MASWPWDRLIPLARTQLWLKLLTATLRRLCRLDVVVRLLLDTHELLWLSLPLLIATLHVAMLSHCPMKLF